AQNVQNVIRMVKVFSSWLDREEWTLDDHHKPINVLARLELPKVEQKEVQPLTPEQEATLAKACDDRTLPGCRRLAILLLFLDSGARPGKRSPGCRSGISILPGGWCTSAGRMRRGARNAR